MQQTIIQNRLQQSKAEEEAISKQIASQNVLPSGDERGYVSEIIRKVSSKYSEDLLTKDTDLLKGPIQSTVEEECKRLENLSFEEKKRVEKIVLLTVLGNGPIEPYLNDPTVTEIVVQRYDNIVIERNGKIEQTDVTFTDENHLQTIIKRIVQRAGRQISITQPIVDTRLPDGSRVNATIPPVSIDGATLTIRKFSKKVLSGEDYIEKGSMDARMLYFLSLCVCGRMNIVVSGGTGTGKTTLLNMLSSYIPETELIVTIEDTAELKLQQKNVRRMETRLAQNNEMMNVNQSMLVKAALRQRPDRIILGEARDGAIVDIISAMSTGHEGSLTTIHATSPEVLFKTRLQILYDQYEGVKFSSNTIAMQAAEAFDIVVQIERFPDGSRKITHISYVDKAIDTPTGKEVVYQDIFYHDKKERTFKYTGIMPQKILDAAQFWGYEIDTRYFG